MIMRARVFDGTDRRPRQSRIRVLLVIGIGMAWAWAWAWGIAVYAQPAPERVQRGRARTVASRELGRKLAASIDAGDSYPSANGSQHLRRVPGRLALPLSTADASLAKRGGPGRPLAGYRVAARPARMLAILETTGTEVERQRRDPGVLRETLRRARAGGGMGPVNPVFLDPHSGLELLATEQVVIALRPGTDAARYFGRGWKQVRPVWGAADQFLLTLPQATAEEVFAEVGRRLHDAAVVWAEPDFIRQGIKASTPSDPDFSLQWHLYNTGQGGGQIGRAHV